MKKCSICGAVMPDESVQCPQCKADAGTAIPLYAPNGPGPHYAYGGVSPQEKPVNGKGLAGMIVGILSYVFCWVPILGFVLGLIGVILSGIGLSRKDRYRLNGFAVAGLILSILALVWGLIYIFVFFIVIAAAV